MKKHDSLFRLTLVILFLCMAVFQSAYASQQLIAEKDQDIYFIENGEKIYPRVDYSRIYVVFPEEKSPRTAISLLAEIPGLKAIANEEGSFSSKRSDTYKLSAPGVEEAMKTIESIRSLEGIESAYPFLLREGDYASVNPKVLVNINNDQLGDFLATTDNSQIIEELEIGNSTSLVFKVPVNESVFHFASNMSGSGLVNYSQPDFVFRGHSHFDPNDPYYTSQWFLEQSNDADIDASQAWDITQGAGSSVVAVIDGNGYDLQHSEMANKYIAPYCAVNDNNDPSATHPDENHGTPCSGLIGALTNNSSGVSSVGYYCKVMPIRIGHDFNGGSFQTSSSIIQRAAQHVTSSSYNVFAVSNSIGLGTWANIVAVRDAYESMRTQSRNGKGSVILASTGNDDASSLEQYPCFFPNVVGVGASNSSDQRAYFSNYGDSCDIVAPGLDLWTLDRSGSDGYIFGDYFEFSGTSAACPVAAGVVGLMGTMFPNYTEGQLRSKLYSACEKVGQYTYGTNNAYPFGSWNNEMGYGRINAYLAVQGGSQLDPPTNLQASNNNQNVNLSWTAPAGGNDEWISYNDGTFENSFASTDGGQGLGQQFTLPEVPSTLKEVRFFVSDYQNYSADIDVYILSGNGTDVLYGPITVGGANNDWVSVSIPDVVINQSTFMVATYNVNADGPYIGVDEDNYNGGLYFGDHLSGFTEMSEYDYYYVGSHEAYIEYSDADAFSIKRKIEPAPAMNSAENLASSGDHLIKSSPAPADRGFLYYKVYRNGTFISNSNQTSVADVLPSQGTYAYTVTAYYDEGESDPAGPASVTWSGGGSTVTVSGLVKDAVNGNPVEGAIVSIAGLSDYSDSQGNYTINDVPTGALTADFSANPEWGVVPLTVQFSDLSGYGNQALSCSKAGYTTYEDDHVSVPPGAPLTYNISLSPQLSTGEMRFVLSWEATPPDLDIHLLTPSIQGSTYHVYWEDMGNADQPPYATLDNDETGGFGPETITIVQMFDGTYKVYVLQYDEDAPIAGCGAMVKIYNDNGLLQTVNVPQTGPNDYYYWYICDVNGANGSVSVKNILMNQAPGFADFVFPSKEKNKYVMNAQENNLASWYWDFGDGVTDNQQNPVHTYTSVGTYNVSLTYSDGAGQVTEVKNGYITVGEQSIGENELSSLTRVWPNPARETVSVSCSVRINHISLFDLNGQMLMQFECNEKQIRLNLADVLPGMYHLLLDTENGKAASRLIVR